MTGGVEERAVSRPPRRKGRELVLAILIALVWYGIVKLVLRGQPIVTARAPDAIPGLILTGLGCWGLAELVARRHLMLWPGSALGILGPLTFGIAAAMWTPELRALPALQKLPVIYGVTSAGMLVFLLRFRLPGLVSPVALFATVALFLWLTQGNPQALAKVEGLTPRGVLAALMDRPAVVAVFSTLGFAACWLGWHLDRKADYFGVEAARPLHIVGAGVLALIAGKFAGGLPAWIDVAAVLALWAALLVWSLRIDRMAVFSAGTIALTRPLGLGVAEPLGIRLDIWQWGGIYTAMTGLAMIAWLVARRHSYPAGWTRRVRNIRWEWTDPAFMSRRQWKQLMDARRATREPEGRAPAAPPNP